VPKNDHSHSVSRTGSDIDTKRNSKTIIISSLYSRKEGGRKKEGGGGGAMFKVERVSSVILSNRSPGRDIRISNQFVITRALHFAQ